MKIVFGPRKNRYLQFCQKIEEKFVRFLDDIDDFVYIFDELMMFLFTAQMENIYIKNQQFGKCSEDVSIDKNYKSNKYGILGLTFMKNSPLFNIREQNIFRNNVFSFNLKR